MSSSPPDEYVPRRHRGQQPPQSRITQQAGQPLPQHEPDIDDHAAEAEPPEVDERLKQLATAIESDPPPANLPTRAEAVHQQAISSLDLLTAHTVQRLDELSAEIVALKDVILADNRNAKAFLSGHVDLAGTAVSETNRIGATVKALREQRAKLVNPSGH